MFRFQKRIYISVLLVQLWYNIVYNISFLLGHHQAEKYTIKIA